MSLGLLRVPMSTESCWSLPELVLWGCDLANFFEVGEIGTAALVSPRTQRPKGLEVVSMIRILNFQSQEGPGGAREVRILLQMLVDKLGPDWEAQHLLEDQLEDLVHSIIVQDNFPTVSNFVNDRQPDGVPKKER